MMSLESRVNNISWHKYSTAYGPATSVPPQLIRLASDNLDDAKTASHELWCGLCHQHAYLSSAAMPALPFLLEILERSDDIISIEILDILLGFARCSSIQNDRNPDWLIKINSELCSELSRFTQLTLSSNQDISYFATEIILALTGVNLE